jgi:hypothetical protein
LCSIAHDHTPKFFRGADFFSKRDLNNEKKKSGNGYLIKLIRKGKGSIHLVSNFLPLTEGLFTKSNLSGLLPEALLSGIFFQKK